MNSYGQLHYFSVIVTYGDRIIILIPASGCWGEVEVRLMECHSVTFPGPKCSPSIQWSTTYNNQGGGHSYWAWWLRSFRLHSYHHRRRRRRRHHHHHLLSQKKRAKEVEYLYLITTVQYHTSTSGIIHFIGYKYIPANYTQDIHTLMELEWFHKHSLAVQNSWLKLY